MFAWTRITSVIAAAACVAFTPGCQRPVTSPPNGTNQQHTPASTKDQSRATDAQVEAVPAIQARTFIAAGRLHESQGRLLQAIQQYQFAMKADPANAEIQGRIGVLYDRLGDGAAAEVAYQRALKIAPGSAQLHNNLAFSYILRKQWAQAETELKRALEINPRFARARVNLGMVLAQQDRFEEALAQFKMTLPPEDAQYNLGLMYQSKRKTVEAAQAYKRALQLNPKLTAAQEQLKRLPAAVLSAADQKLQQEAQALALANKPKPAPSVPQAHPRAPALGGAQPEAPVWNEPDNQSAEADDEDSNAVATSSTDVPKCELLVEWPRLKIDLLSILAGSKPLAAVDAVPMTATTRPAQLESDAQGAPAQLGVDLASDLDSLLPAWQQSPELISELALEASRLSRDADDDWFDWQESPAALLDDRSTRETDRSVKLQASTQPH